MTSIARLKDKARKHEQKEDWQAAIQAYQKVLDAQDEEEDLDLDLTLFNRIGDLNLRLGQTDEAVSFYEKAADKYAESGFYNNAIALCNKALRHRPDRAAIYLKLSRLCTEQGFQTDARRWILEYAERQVAAGEVEAALTGLEEFAELSDDPEVRELLAQQLASHDRAGEAVEQLRTAYGMRVRAGETEQAAEVAEKARAIDPTVDLEAETPAPAAAGEADPTGDEAPAEFGTEPRETGAPAGGAPEIGAAEPMAAESTEDESEAEPAEDMGLGDELEPTVAEVPEEPAPSAEGIEGLETRSETVDEAEAGEEPGGIAGLEVSYSEREDPALPEDAEGESLGGLESFSQAAPEAESDEEPESAGDLEAPDAADLEEFGEDEEEAEPLPLLDTGYDDEDAEPLPMLDTGHEADVETPEGAVEAADEGMDLSFDEADVGTPPEDAAPADVEVGEAAGAAGEAGSGPGDDAMDLDFGSFDLGFESTEADAPDVEVEDLDIDAIMNRARELVSRGLTGEALRELHLLSASGADADVFKDALAVVNEIVRHDENDIAALQRRVEYGARIGDRELLVETYLDLAEALDRLGAETKARAMFERVLDLDPSNEVAREALGEEAEEEDAVDLDAILQEMEPEEMAAAADERASDPNFSAMLNQFKAKVTENVDPDDAGDHYDLGLAFKEMGLIDEAIAEFQTALTGGEERLKVYEELGQCFIQKGQYNVAVKVFDRALKVPHTDADDLLGVYYHLGQCYEELGQREQAREAYEKVLAIDGSFGDVPDRMARL